MPTYQAPQIDASSSFDAARGNEWGRNGWTKESYDRKNQEPVNFYDFTRKKLNFEIKRGEPLKDKDGIIWKAQGAIWVIIGIGRFRRVTIMSVMAERICSGCRVPVILMKQHGRDRMLRWI